MRAFLGWMMALGVGLAHAHGAHQHGVGRLQVVAEGPALTIRLEGPLDNLLGFEHTPRNARERAAAAALMQRLREGKGLFGPSAAAGCTLAAAQVEAPVLEGGRDHDGHAELAAEWRYTCAQPERLTGLRVNLFRVFPRLRTLEAAVAGPRGQRGARLSARAPDLNW
ncbi:MAG: DUF2796 domain-containing protein [Thiobacillaceae bacterium]